MKDNNAKSSETTRLDENIWCNSRLRVRSEDRAEVAIILVNVMRGKSGEVIDWIVQAANEDALREFGLPVDALIHRRATELFQNSPAVCSLITHSNETITTGKSLEYDLHLPWIDKSLFLTVSRLDHQTLIITSMNITKIMQVEDELRANRALLTHIIDSTPSYIFARDLDGKIILLNEMIAKQHHIPKEQAIGMFANDIWGKEIADTVRECEAKVISEETPYLSEENIIINGYPYTYITSKFPLCDGNGKIYGIGGVITDITELKQAESAIHESEIRWRTAVESAGIGVWELDLDNHKTWHSLNHDRIFGYEQAVPEWNFTMFMDHVLQEERDLVYSKFRSAVESRMPWDYNCRIHRNDGVVRWVWVHGQFRYDERDKSARVFGLIRDITEEKALEETLREADRRKDEFLGMLSHELRNPLASMRNCLYILDHVTPGGEQAIRAKKIIDRQFGQLCHLVDDLLDITRISVNKIQLKKEILELNDLVHRTIEDNRSLFKDNEITLETNTGFERVYVNVDGTRVSQIIGNLLQNAAKFTDRNGRVQISVETDFSSQKAVIRVVDNGIGMNPEIVESVFEPFTQGNTTLDRSRGGLGLGLALVKNLVELHGGDVSVVSQGPGKGSEFIVRLPLESAAAPEVENPAECVPGRSGRRVLIIEDNIDVADSLYDILKLSGHEVMVAFDGLDGLDKARQFHPEVLLCDIGLPDMDGYAVARAFRADEALKTIYLVALTGYALPVDSQRAAEAGFNKHLAKPVSQSLLEQILA